MSEPLPDEDLKLLQEACDPGRMSIGASHPGLARLVLRLVEEVRACRETHVHVAYFVCAARDVEHSALREAASLANCGLS